MGPVILQTPRLFLREFTQEDFPQLLSLMQDRAAVYAYEHDFMEEEVKEWLGLQLYRYRADQIGFWGAFHRETAELVGHAGLSYEEICGRRLLDSGYLLKHAFWHMGYGSELLSACRDYAFHRLGAESVYSVTKADDIAFQKVAKSIGMKKVKEFKRGSYQGEVLCFLYEAVQK